MNAKLSKSFILCDSKVNFNNQQLQKDLFSYYQLFILREKKNDFHSRTYNTSEVFLKTLTFINHFNDKTLKT